MLYICEAAINVIKVYAAGISSLDVELLNNAIYEVSRIFSEQMCFSKL